MLWLLVSLFDDTATAAAAVPALWVVVVGDAAVVVGFWERGPPETTIRGDGGGCCCCGWLPHCCDCETTAGATPISVMILPPSSSACPRSISSSSCWVVVIATRWRLA